MCVITPEWTHSTWNQVWTLSNLMAFPPCIAELYCDSRFCSPTNNIADNSHYLYTYGYTMWDYAFQFRAWSKCLQDVLYILTRAGCVDKLICTWLSLPHFSCACIVHISETTSFFRSQNRYEARKTSAKKNIWKWGMKKEKDFFFFFITSSQLAFLHHPKGNSQSGRDLERSESLAAWTNGVRRERRGFSLFGSADTQGH